MTWWRDVIAVLIVLACMAVASRQTYVTRRRHRYDHDRARRRLALEQIEQEQARVYVCGSPEDDWIKDQENVDTVRRSVVKLERRG